MRVGVVCEGQTDYITMVSFLSAELSRRGVAVQFEIIQPALDNTLPAGWTQVFYWLQQNPAANRNALYRKGQSLFASEDEEKKFDALIFQIDTDIIGEPSFENFIIKHGLTCIRPETPSDRSSFVRGLIYKIAGYSSLEDAISAKEIPIALVESCETWVVAAASDDDDAETLTPEELQNRFGAVVSEQSNQPVQPTYASINKKMKTRDRICSKLSKEASPAAKAPHFDQTVEEISNVLGSE